MPAAVTKPRFALAPALLFAVGLGMAIHHADIWSRLPEFSAAELEQSVEVNLAIDLQQHSGRATPSDGELRALRRQIRAELDAEIIHERRAAQRGFATGFSLLLAGLALMIWLRRMAAC